MNIPQPLKTLFDCLSGGITIATFLSWLPHIAAVLAVIWGFYRIYEVRLNIKLLKKQLGE